MFQLVVLGCLVLVMLNPTTSFVLRMVSSSVDQTKNNLPRKPAPATPPITASQPPRPPSRPTTTATTSTSTTTTTAPRRKAHTNKYAAFSKKEVDPLRAAIDKKQQIDVEEEKKQASMVPSRGTTVPIPVSSFRPVATNESTTSSSTATSAVGEIRKRKKLVKSSPDDTKTKTTTKKVAIDNNGPAAATTDLAAGEEEPVVQATLKPLFFANVSAIVPSDPYTFGYTHIGTTTNPYAS